MSGEMITAISVVLAALFALGGTIYGVRKSLKSTDGKDRYDQLQEDLEAERRERIEQSREQNAKIARLEGQVGELQAEKRVRDDYIAVLRQWIEDHSPPPPPPYPIEMRR